MSDTIDAISKFNRLLLKAPPAFEKTLVAFLESASSKLEPAIDAVIVSERLRSVPLYSDRADGSEIALQYFERVYSKILDEGNFYADDLRQHDRPLYGALSAYLAQRGQTLASIMPVRTTRRPGRYRRSLPKAA